MIKNKVLQYSVVFILIVLRFFYLDQDAPSYMIGGICQEDEPYYSLEAINRYNTDNARTIEGFEHVNGGGLMLYSLPLTYLSLKAIGNTYWGFRLPVVLIGLLIIYLLYDILRKLKIPGKVVALVMLYVLTDFYFFLFSRFQTPQIYSILGITWVLWLYFKYGLSGWKGIFLIGSFVAFAIFFIYAYNAFLALVFGILVLRLAYRQRSLKPILLFASGFILCFLMYCLALLAIDSSLGETIKLLTLHGGGVDKSAMVENAQGFMGLVKKVYAMFIQLPVANVFRYNLPVLFMFLFTLPFIFYQALKIRSEKHLMYILFMVAIMLQACFAMSYPFKKLIIIFPLLVIILGDVVPQLSDFYRQMNLKSKMYLIIYSILVLGVCLINFRLNNSRVYWDGLNYGYYANTGRLFNALNLLLLFVAVAILIISSFSNKIKYTIPLSLSLVLGVFLTVQYCFVERTFYAKEGFTGANTVLKDKGVIMSACYAAQFYTNCKPALGCYADVLFLGHRYKSVADSLFKTGRAEFTIRKIMPSDTLKLNEDPGLIPVMRIPMRYYFFEIYRYIGLNNGTEK